MNINKIIALLALHYPNARTHLKFNTGFELLIAAILAAQCPDERVNKVTEVLFKKYKTIKDFSKVSLKELIKDISIISFCKNKAKSIIELSRKLLDKYNGVLSETLNELVTLPGVGRKTANLVLASAFNKPGIVVDTHVKRVSFRLGLTKNTDPKKIEMDLNKIIPQNHWINFSYRLMEHGRILCKAKNPKCTECFLKELCVYYIGGKLCL